MNTPKPWSVYVAVHLELRSVKVGCMAADSGRLEQLARYGWTLHQRLDLASIDLARETEQATLFDLRHRLLVPVHLTPEQLRGGWTETASAALVSASRMWDLVGDHAGAAYLAPVVRRVPGRRGPKTPPTPPRRVPGDTPSYSRAAREAARHTANKQK